MPIETVETAGRRRGADLLVEVLRSEGVRYIFGNPGTTELPLIDALTEAPDIAYILAPAGGDRGRHGRTATRRARRRPAFLNLHTAGGLGHAMGGLVNSQVSGTPLVVTAGQQDLRHALTDPLLMGDLVAIADPVMKWAREVTSPDQIPILLRRAFHDAGAAPSGPVFLSLPMDVMEAMSTVPAGETSTIDQRGGGGLPRSLGRKARRDRAGPPSP